MAKTINSLGSRGLHHVALASKDFDKSLEFYVDGLGLSVFRAWGEPGGRGVMLDLGAGVNLEIFERPDHTGMDGQILHLAIRVDNCRAAHAACLEAGAGEQTAPKDLDIPSHPPYPVTISFVRGPDGEEIELFEER